jgi:hypothetical protein
MGQPRNRERNRRYVSALKRMRHFWEIAYLSVLVATCWMWIVLLKMPLYWG